MNKQEDRNVQATIDRLPRTYKGVLNARCWQDDAGRICVDIADGGALIFDNNLTSDDWLYELSGGEDE